MARKRVHGDFPSVTSPRNPSRSRASPQLWAACVHRFRIRTFSGPPGTWAFLGIDSREPVWKSGLACFLQLNLRIVRHARKSRYSQGASEYPTLGASADTPPPFVKRQGSGTEQRDCNESNQHTEIRAGLVHSRPESLFEQHWDLGGRNCDHNIDEQRHSRKNSKETDNQKCPAPSAAGKRSF